MNISKLNSKNFIYRYVHIRQNHGIHMRPSICITKLTNLDRRKNIYIARKNSTPQEISHSMINILSQCLQKGETIKLLALKDYPKCLFDIIAACLSAKNVYECIKITKEFLDKNNGKLLK